MAGTASRRLAILERQTKVRKMYIAKWSFREIARDLGISVAQAHRDVEAVKAQLVHDNSHTLQQKILRELATLDWVEREARKQWEASKSAEEITSSEKQTSAGTGEAGGDERTTIGAKRRNRVADSRFLAVVIDCVRERLNIIGGYAPKKLVAKLAGSDPADNATQDQIQAAVDSLSENELNLLTALQAKFESQLTPRTIDGKVASEDSDG